MPTSPFLELPQSARVASNALCFAVRDKYPVSPGHTLVIPKRLVATWFDATPEEQRALMALVNEVKAQLDQERKPDGYNVGFNAGEAAGQTVMHLHVHVIPRYRDDMFDPRGGVRHVIPSKGNYVASHPPLATGGDDDPFALHVAPLFDRAERVAIVAAFVQESGLDVMGPWLSALLQRGGDAKLLTGDYLGITQAAALETLLDWQDAHRLPEDDEAEPEATTPRGSFEARVIEVDSKSVHSFHPKSWRFEGRDLAVAFVGSSNISRSALGRGIEWNLRVNRDRDADAYRRVTDAFDALWSRARPLTREWVENYARRARTRAEPLPPGEEDPETPQTLPEPHEAQEEALKALREARQAGRERALAVFATGLGKTLLSVLDYAQLWEELDREWPPRLLFLAHRRELLLQAARAFRTLLREQGSNARVGWFAEDSAELNAELVFASVSKLARKPHLERLAAHRFDYIVVDEVHHAAANSYRRILSALDGGFRLGLTATPDRADGADILGLFDDFVAHRAGIDEGIRLDRLVPFHYFGVKDDIDYENIPWRNRRFDPEVLAASVQNEARMETLWRAWQKHPGERTLVFCCSVAHANYARDWLKAKGLEARAIHSDPSADLRSESLRALGEGEIDAVCAVDVLNEGVDIPGVDRVVMLRPTESNVVFLQQLGRGLRADPASDKQALTVIDFVGNHRMFLDRLRALLSLGAGRGASELRRLLEDEPLQELPEGCSVEVELEAKTLLNRLFRSDGATEVERAYRELSASREGRPRAGELHRMGYSVASLRSRHSSWFEFVAGEGDLTPEESRVLEEARAFLADLETTAMTKSFKMVTLQALIEHDALESGMELEELARRAHAILRRDPTLLADVPEALRDDPEESAWLAYWKKNPIAAWTGANGTRRAWFAVEGERFVPQWQVPDDLRGTLAAMLTELVDYRLAQYRARFAQSAGAQSFTCKVLWNKRDPILKLPRRDDYQIPEGEVDARLEDGSVWVFRLMKEFCNVARPAGTDRNQLPDLLRGWFGPAAGQPGTSFKVRFEAGPDGLTLRPEREAQVIAFPRRQLVAYPDLQAAAGHATTSSLPPEATAVELPIDEGDLTQRFAVRVSGSSMDGGRAPLRDGDWAVFRLARGASPSEVQGRVALVQLGGEQDGFRYQIKRVTRGGAGWVLKSDNPEGPTIPADASMTVIARLERSFAPERLAPERGGVMRTDELGPAFGVGTIEARTDRYGGHLFLFVKSPGDLLAPDLAALQVSPRPAETAYVLTDEGDGRWRFVGVGRQDEEASGWRIREVDAGTWKRFAAGKAPVSRRLPPGAQSRAQLVLDALMSLSEEERWIEQANGSRARVLERTRSGLRVQGESAAARVVSLTDLAWVVVAANDVAEHGGLLDEARVNRLRYLPGTEKGSTRWIDTRWALAIWDRVKDRLPERTEDLRVFDKDGNEIDATFYLERRDGETWLVFLSRGGKPERNTEYNTGLELVLNRLKAQGVQIGQIQLDSKEALKVPEEERVLRWEGLSDPIEITDAKQLRRAIGKAAARKLRAPEAKGGGNMTKQVRLLLSGSKELETLGELLRGKTTG